MFSVYAWNENASDTTAFVNLLAVKDDIARAVGDVLYCPKFTRVLWVAAVGLDMGKAKLESPSIRKMGVLDINPHCNYDYIPEGAIPSVRNTVHSPITLVEGEGIEAFAYVGSDTTAFQAIVVALGDAPVTPITGEIWTVRATCAETTPIETEWVGANITFDETLPVGEYQVVGCEVWMDRGLAFRLIPVGALHRPGGLICMDTIQQGPKVSRWGAMGEWCRFHSSTPPKIEIIASDLTPSTISVHLDIIKIA